MHFRYTVTVTATMSHSESFMDDPQSSTIYEAKGLWKDAFKALYEFYQHRILCDVEIEVRELEKIIMALLFEIQNLEPFS